MMVVKRTKIFTLEKGEKIDAPGAFINSGYQAFGNSIFPPPTKTLSLRKPDSPQINITVNELYYFIVNSNDKQYVIMNGNRYGNYEFVSLVLLGKTAENFFYEAHTHNGKYIFKNTEQYGSYGQIGLFYTNDNITHWAAVIRKSGGEAVIIDGEELPEIFTDVSAVYLHPVDKKFRIVSVSIDRKYYLSMDENGKQVKHDGHPVFTKELELFGEKNVPAKGGNYFRTSLNSYYGLYDKVEFLKMNRDYSEWVFEGAHNGKKYVYSSKLGELGPFNYVYCHFTGNEQKLFIEAQEGKNHFLIDHSGNKIGPFKQMSGSILSANLTDYAYAVNEKNPDPELIFNVEGKWNVVNARGEKFGTFNQVNKILISADGNVTVMEVKQKDGWHILFSTGEDFSGNVFGLFHTILPNMEYFSWFSREEFDVYLNKAIVR